jgi:group I intron endonuclease
MRLFKSHPILRLANSYLVDSPQPINLSYMWNFGSLLAFCLIIQIVTGVTLAMHYNPSVAEAFNSVEHIMRDVNNGWLIRYLHSNTASAFFFLVYLHIGRNIYYGSYRAPRTLVFTIGVVIFILMMATAFLGYQHSPKWFDISNKESVNFNKNNVMNFKVNSKRLFNKSIVKRGYSTSSSSNSTIMSERLESIINELGLNLVYCYENLNLEETRKQILKDTRGLSGVYMIINKTTKDYYIGSASTGRFYARFCNHVIYFRGSKIVKLAIKKYDLKNFAFVVLDLYPNIVTKENNHELLHLEDKYLKLLVPNYNILTEAGSSFGYKHTEIDRQKMKDIYSDARREQIGKLNKGKNLSHETIERIREKALLKPPMSDETKKKCIVNTRPVVLYNLDRTIYGQYPTILEAAKAINCNEKTIRRALQTEKKLVKRQWIVEDMSRNK